MLLDFFKQKSYVNKIILMREVYFNKPASFRKNIVQTSHTVKVNENFMATKDKIQWYRFE